MSPQPFGAKLSTPSTTRSRQQGNAWSTMTHSAWWWQSHTEHAVAPVPSVGHLVPNEVPEQIAEIVEAHGRSGGDRQ
jgi:hypothetical protein